MMTPQSLPWAEPLAMAAAIDEAYWVLLYSSAATSYSGRYSYLACGLEERIEADDFNALQAKLTSDGTRFENAWFGYFGYGLKDGLETLTPEQAGDMRLAKLCMMRFGSVYEFDHAEKRLTCWSHGTALTPVKAPPASIPHAGNIVSNMSKQEYLAKVSDIIGRIHAGDLYQANLTRKFSGTFSHIPEALPLFTRLCETSPAPYSACLRLDDTFILSSSPERFLRVDSDGAVSTRPIKGTAPRHADSAQDKASRDALYVSAKDRAENLMIVDLMRNDLSRSCIPGSIGASELFAVTTHATIHHMSGTVNGRKHPDRSTLDVIKGCFPPGSMTGAPKIRAMELCTKLEGKERGVYSGAIGWLGGDGACELSVVIRTLVVRGSRFEFQVGGGIVADSTPEREWRETVEKAAGMLAALGLTRAEIENI